MLENLGNRDEDELKNQVTLHCRQATDTRSRTQEAVIGNTGNKIERAALLCFKAYCTVMAAGVSHEEARMRLRRPKQHPTYIHNELWCKRAIRN